MKRPEPGCGFTPDRHLSTPSKCGVSVGNLLGEAHSHVSTNHLARPLVAHFVAQQRTSKCLPSVSYVPILLP